MSIHDWVSNARAPKPANVDDIDAKLAQAETARQLGAAILAIGLQPSWCDMEAARWSSAAGSTELSSTAPARLSRAMAEVQRLIAAALRKESKAPEALQSDAPCKWRSMKLLPPHNPTYADVTMQLKDVPTARRTVHAVWTEERGWTFAEFVDSRLEAPVAWCPRELVAPYTGDMETLL